MIRKPLYKVSRRVGEAIYSKTQTPKFAAHKAIERGRIQKHRSTRTEYGNQLTEKQKIRLSYGIGEGAMRRIMQRTRKEKGAPAELLMQNLERRFDNVIYRSGLAKNRTQSRQIISHGHILINGRISRSPSRLLRIHDAVSMRKQSEEKKSFIAITAVPKHVAPQWLSVDKGVATVRALPTLADADTTLAWSAVTDFYSRA